MTNTEHTRTPTPGTAPTPTLAPTLAPDLVPTLVHRLFRALDARDFDAGGAMAGLVTPDVRMETPVGAGEGADEATRGAVEALAPFVATQHIASGILVDGHDPGAGSARASWNALMTHVYADGTLFTVGGLFDADLRWTPDDGWRFSRVAVRPLWTQGTPPQTKETKQTKERS
ncbi:nuclear transport factor 2 family protein [Streptomyces sp. NPDC093252]|uniref:nuclear transport factor 2 family protein n=1 Tax=Streptomyces sp. NPDC093252 TaxID=3154980 RepID=UPI003431465F